MTEPRRWTLMDLSRDQEPPIWGIKDNPGPPSRRPHEWVEVMPVTEHKELRDAAQAVLDTLDRSSSFSVNQVDRLRAALDLAGNRGNERS